LTYNVIKPKTTSTWPFIILGVLIGAGVFAVWFMRIEPFYGVLNPYVTSVVNAVANIIPTLSATFEGIWNAFLQNPIAYAATGITAIGGIYALISKIRADHAKQQIELVAAQREAEFQNDFYKQAQTLGQKETQLQELQQKISQLENNNSPNLLSEAQTVISQKNQELQMKNAEVQALQRVIAELKVKVKEVVVVK